MSSSASRREAARSGELGRMCGRAEQRALPRGRPPPRPRWPRRRGAGSCCPRATPTRWLRRRGTRGGWCATAGGRLGGPSSTPGRNSPMSPSPAPLQLALVHAEALNGLLDFVHDWTKEPDIGLSNQNGCSGVARGVDGALRPAEDREVLLPHLLLRARQQAPRILQEAAQGQHGATQVSSCRCELQSGG